MSRAERIAALNANDVFLPSDHVWWVVIPTIATTAASLTAMYTLSSYVLDRLQLVPLHSDVKTRRKVCYQMTNFCINLLLGVTGGYYDRYHVQQHQPPYTLDDTVAGCLDLHFFASVQIGYQLWSIPVGLWLVHEQWPMLAHHVAVVAVAAMSAFLTNGYRYWTPFFYGLMELSSVPLAVMNTFKDNPQWIQQRPQLYTAVRLLFCASFLWIRIYCYVPRKIQYLRDHYSLWSTATLVHMEYPNLYRTFMGSVWIGTVFLLFLQLYWATLILQGLFKLVTGKQSSKSSSQRNGSTSAGKKIE